jgi:hypothetical protein
MLLREFVLLPLALWNVALLRGFAAQGVPEDDDTVPRPPDQPSRIVQAGGTIACSKALTAYQDIMALPTAPKTWPDFICAMMCKCMTRPDEICVMYNKSRDPKQYITKGAFNVPKFVEDQKGILSAWKLLIRVPKGCGVPSIPEDQFLISTFIQDLPPGVAAQVRSHLKTTDTLERVHDLALFHSGALAPLDTAPLAPLSMAPPPDSMDLSALRTTNNGRLTPQERQRRIEANQCLACGGNDHYKSDPRCPVSGGKKRQGQRPQNTYNRTNGARGRFNALEAVGDKLDKLAALLESKQGNDSRTE